MGLILATQAPHVGAQSDARKEAIQQRVHLTVQTLRDLVRPTNKRVGFTARELLQIGPDAKAALIDLAEDPVAAVRQAAIQTLGMHQDENLVPVLIQSLADRSPRVVIAAIKALASHDGDWPTRALVRYLGHPDAEVRKHVLAAIEPRPREVVYTIVRKLLLSPPADIGRGPYLAALGRFPDENTLVDLIRELDDPKIGFYAVRGLEYFGSTSAPLAVSWLITSGEQNIHVAAALCDVIAAFPELGSASIQQVTAKAPVSVKRVAVQAKVRRTTESAGRWLTELSGHPDGRVRQVGLEAMAFTKGADPVAYLKENLWHVYPEVRMLAAKATRKSVGNSTARDQLIRRYRHLGVSRGQANLDERLGLIGSIAGIGGNTSVSELIHALGYQDEAPAAIEGLGMLGVEAVRSLLFVIKTDDMRRAPHAVRALARVGRPAFDPMVLLLSHPNMEVRNIARSALAKMRATAVVPEIVKLVDSPRTPARKKLVALLGRLPCKDSLDALIRFATGGNQHNLRLAAVKALSKLPYDPVVTTLRTIAEKDDNNEVRLWAVQTLVGRGDKGSVPLFKKMLAYEKPFIKQACAFGIGYLGQPSDIPSVGEQMLSPRPFVLRAIRDGLRRITYQPDFKYEEQFNDWLDEHKEREVEKYSFRKATMRLTPVSSMTYWLGGDEGDALLVLHGGPDLDHRYLQPGYDRLSKHRVLFYVDLPGRGESQLKEWPRLGVEADADSVALLLAKLNMRNVDVLAHDWGAHVAVKLAEKYPKLVNRLILDNPAAPTFSGWLADVQQAELAAKEPWKSDIQLMKNPLPLFYPEVRDLYASLGLFTARLFAPAPMVHIAPLLAPNLEFRSIMLEAMGEFDFSASYANVGKETLIINGKATPSLPVVLVDPSKKPNEKSRSADKEKKEKKVHWSLNLALGNKKIRVTTIDNAGLLPALENPEQFESAVLSFLKQ
jgi:HEAT repeat protein/pimeloyl-ACP methyl ester carboxylesterase